MRNQGIRLHRLPIYSRMIRKGGCNRVFLIGRARRLPSENRRYSDFDQQEHNDTLRGLDEESFLVDEKTINAVAHNHETVGEGAHAARLPLQAIISVHSC